VIAAIVELIWGVAAEQKPLEEVAKPLSELQAEKEGKPEKPRRREPRVTYGTMWAPRVAYSSDDPAFADREVELIAQALEGGQASRRDLASKVRARYWGPRRFRRALRIGVARGRFRQVGRDRYELTA
jgi:hypothetical protein